MALRTRSLHRWIAAIAVATHALVALPGGALAQPASAKEALANADKAAKAKDWAKAQSEYRAAYQAAPTAQALNGLASASYELGAWGEAYEAYDEFLKTYPDAMGRGAKALAEKRVKELDAKTGALTILVNESGADVSLDDKKIGASPVRALIRVGTGSHSLKVSKAGFAAFEKSVDVAPGAKVSVDVNLVKGAKTGKLTVKEAGGQAVRVFVDNVDMGPAPWTGDVDPGSHQVRVQSGTLGSTSQKVEVEAGKTGEVTIAATSASGRLSIATSDGLGVIYVDGKVVGEGQFSGDVPAGSHDVRITREGFVPFEKRYEVGDKQSVSETVPLKTAGQSLDAVKVEEERAFYGMYGGFGLLGGIGVGGLGSSLDLTSDSCQKTLGAVSCDTPGPMGGGAFGYVGFTWLPVGSSSSSEGSSTKRSRRRRSARPIKPTRRPRTGAHRGVHLHSVRRRGRDSRARDARRKELPRVALGRPRRFVQADHHAAKVGERDGRLLRALRARRWRQQPGRVSSKQAELRVAGARGRSRGALAHGPDHRALARPLGLARDCGQRRRRAARPHAPHGERSAGQRAAPHPHAALRAGERGPVLPGPLPRHDVRPLRAAPRVRAS
ncbi:MAG: PEGA domain-containing protein [Polyangiaceae bacterium]